MSFLRSHVMDVDDRRKKYLIRRLEITMGPMTFLLILCGIGYTNILIVGIKLFLLYRDSNCNSMEMSAVTYWSKKLHSSFASVESIKTRNCAQGENGHYIKCSSHGPADVKEFGLVQISYRKKNNHICIVVEVKH